MEDSYCSQDKCSASAMEENDNRVFILIITLTSCVTCFLVIFDFVSRHFNRKPVNKKPEYQVVSSTQCVETTSSVQTGAGEASLMKEDASRTTNANSSSNILSAIPEVPDLEKAEKVPIVELTAATQNTGNESKPDVTPHTQDGDLTSENPSSPMNAACELLNNLVDALRTNVDYSQSYQKTPEACASSVEAIAGLQESCNHASSEFDRLSIALVRDVTAEDGPENMDSAQTAPTSLADYLQERRSIYRGWQGVRRLLFCADVHLRNAATYHQFFYEAYAGEKAMEKYLAEISQTLESSSRDNGTSLSSAIKQFTTIRDTVQLWATTTRDLIMRSYSVCPVNQRTEAITDPVPARAICSYTGKTLSVQDGDLLTLLNNEDNSAWKVRTASGYEGELPALCCVIPPPNNSAEMFAEKLASRLSEMYSLTQQLLSKTVIQRLREVLTTSITNKEEYFRVVHEDSQKEFASILDEVQKAMATVFSDHDGNGEAGELAGRVADIVASASKDGEQYDLLDEKVTNDLREILQLIGIYRNVDEGKQEFPTSSCHGPREESLTSQSEWEVLDEAETEAEDTVDISVQSSTTTERAETSSMMSAQGEVRQTFSITGVRDLRDASEISMAEAIERGIINPSEGTYCNLVTGESYPIAVAMTAGYILVESTKTKQMAESTKSVGLVSLTITRETRPYTIQKVLDYDTQEMIPVTKAIEKGIFSRETSRYHNASGDDMSVQEAIDTGCLLVAYDDEDTTSEPEVITQHYAIQEVYNRESGAHVSFDKACEEGILNEDDGSYTDGITGEVIKFNDAFRKGWIKARVVKDPSRIDNIISRRRSLSVDSLSSESSNL